MSIVDDYLSSRNFPFHHPGNPYGQVTTHDKLLIGLFIIDDPRWTSLLIPYIKAFPSNFLTTLINVFKGYYFGVYGKSHEIDFMARTLKIIDKYLHNRNDTYTRRYKILEKILTYIKHKNFLKNPLKIVNEALINNDLCPLLPEEIKGEIPHRAREILMSPNSLYARATELHFRFGHKETLTQEELEEFSRTMRNLGFNPGGKDDLMRQLHQYLMLG